MSDREQIMRRRAAFLTMTLAGCGPAMQPGVAPPATEVAIPAASAPAPASAPASASAPAPASAATTPAPTPRPRPGERPSMTPPASPEGPVKNTATSLLAVIEDLYRRLDAIEAALPFACSGAACKAAIEKAGRQQLEAEDQADRLTFRCPPSSPEGKEMMRWVYAHRDHIGDRLSRLRALGADSAKQKGQGELWERHATAPPRPMVCLSCAVW